jgi:uncharacterized protein (DUF2236 family)
VGGCRITQHSDAFADTVGRLHRTFATVFAMVFGTLDQSLSAARRLHRRHASIKGKMRWTAGPYSLGSTCSANAIPALRWVWATLIDTALLAYQLLLPPITPRQREHYYRESQLFAGLFGIPRAHLPRDWAEFSSYFSAIVQSETLSVSDQARTMARRLVTGADLRLPVPASYQDLTIALLPAPLRDRFVFSFAATQKQQIRRAIALTRRIYPLLAARLRHIGSYQEAQQRLAGRAAPDFVTRLCNLFWIGRAEL